MQITILTLFPEALDPYVKTSIIGRAVENGHITVTLKNIRDYSADKHHTVDDTPYGGGAGMVMKIEPIHRALQDTPPGHVVVLSAKGQQFNQAKAAEYSQKIDHLILICGRYEGIDQRVIDHLAAEELSVGPYVLAGGELPAMIITEAVARLIPGVLGNPESLQDESHQELSLEYPQYTRPEEYNGWKVPDVLLSGNHVEIKKWRGQQKKATL